MKHRMFFAGLLGACLIARAFAADAPAPPVVPAGETPARTPPKTDKKKPAAKKAATKPDATKADATKESKSPAGTTKLAAPEPAVAKEKNVNIRGQARINSEIVAHLTRGQRVTVLEEITTKKKENEPDRWYKVSLPATVPVWVHSSFIDANKAVVPKKLNLRGGPGENYSVIGTIEKGTTVNALETKGDWTKIETPASAYGFIAAHLLSRDPSDVAASAPAIAKHTETTPVTPPPPPPTPPVSTPVPTTVLATPPVVAPTTTETVVPPPPPPTTTVVTPPPPPPVSTPPVLTPVTAPPPEEVLIKRVVTREGIVKGSVSIQAPSYFVLRSLDNNRTINYLVSPSTNIVVSGYRNQRVLITGEESLDERWPNTPVIEIETIQAVEP